MRVAMDLNSPRYSAGASGFMSQVSWWAGPPHMNRTMQAFALRGAVDASRRGRPRPKSGNDPARRNSRRRMIGLLKTRSTTENTEGHGRRQESNRNPNHHTSSDH